MPAARALTTPDKAGDRHGLCPVGDGAALGPYSQPTMPVASVPKAGGRSPTGAQGGSRAGAGRDSQWAAGFLSAGPGDGRWAARVGRRA